MIRLFSFRFYFHAAVTAQTGLAKRRASLRKIQRLVSARTHVALCHWHAKRVKWWTVLIELFLFFPHQWCTPDNVEYVLSSQEDGMVAYRIVSMSDDDTKPSIVHAANETAAMPQQLQYIVIDNVNGYLQAVPTQTSITASTTASISSNSTTSSACMPVSTSRPSVTIAPKTVKTEANKYAHVAPIASTKQSVSNFGIDFRFDSNGFLLLSSMMWTDDADQRGGQQSDKCFQEARRSTTGHTQWSWK